MQVISFLFSWDCPWYQSHQLLAVENGWKPLSPKSLSSFSEDFPWNPILYETTKTSAAMKSLRDNVKDPVRLNESP